MLVDSAPAIMAESDATCLELDSLFFTEEPSATMFQLQTLSRSRVGLFMRILMALKIVFRYSLGSLARILTFSEWRVILRWLKRQTVEVLFCLITSNHI